MGKRRRVEAGRAGGPSAAPHRKLREALAAARAAPGDLWAQRRLLKTFDVEHKQAWRLHRDLPLEEGELETARAQLRELAAEDRDVAATSVGDALFRAVTAEDPKAATLLRLLREELGEEPLARPWFVVTALRSEDLELAALEALEARGDDADFVAALRLALRGALDEAGERRRFLNLLAELPERRRAPIYVALCGRRVSGEAAAQLRAALEADAEGEAEIGACAQVALAALEPGRAEAPERLIAGLSCSEAEVPRSPVEGEVVGRGPGVDILMAMHAWRGPYPRQLALRRLARLGSEAAPLREALIEVVRAGFWIYEALLVLRDIPGAGAAIAPYTTEITVAGVAAGGLYIEAPLAALPGFLEAAHDQLCQALDEAEDAGWVLNFMLRLELDDPELLRRVVARLVSGRGGESERLSTRNAITAARERWSVTEASLVDAALDPTTPSSRAVALHLLNRLGWSATHRASELSDLLLKLVAELGNTERRVGADPFGGVAKSEGTEALAVLARSLSEAQRERAAERLREAPALVFIDKEVALGVSDWDAPALEALGEPFWDEVFAALRSRKREADHLAAFVLLKACRSELERLAPKVEKLRDCRERRQLLRLLAGVEE